jgi:hypothetical protein
LKRGLIALAQGRSRQDIAAQEGVEPATIKRWIETATAEIASSLSEDRGSFGELRGAWVILHQHCCLEAEMEASA